MILTWHANRRALQMGVSHDDVALVVNDAEVSYDQGGKYQGQRIAQRGALAVAYRCQDGEPLVLTVLHRTQEVYAR